MPSEPLKLEVSVATFNEIASKLEAKGLKFGDNIKEIILEKGTELKQPIDYRQATMRKDAAFVAASIFKGYPNTFTIQAIDDIFQYILTGEIVDTLVTTDKLTGEIVTAKWK